MTIELYVEPIFKEIRQKSHLEVQDIQDPVKRDNARAGLDKEEEIRRCMDAGFSQVRRRCHRFLEDDYTQVADDQQGESVTSHVYELAMSMRRGVGKAEPLTAAMHALVVQYALSQFYSSVNQTELSNKHSLAALDAGQQIDELLYAKQPPRI